MIAAVLTVLGLFPEPFVTPLGIPAHPVVRVLALYPAAAYLIMGIAYLTGVAAVFQKGPDGKTRLLAEVILFPYLILYRVMWRLVRQKSSEDKYNEIGNGILVGRRLLAHEALDAEIVCVVDLTSEFSEPEGLAARSAYKTFPTLDGTPVKAADLDAVLAHARDHQRCYIHCAEGHGRAGMVGCLLLMERGGASDVDDAIAKATAARAGIHLRPAQKAALKQYWANR